MIDDLLTPREREVIELIARGYSNNEIMSELDIKKSTLHTHSMNIMQKLNISTYDKQDKTVKRVRIAIAYLKEHRELLDGFEV